MKHLSMSVLLFFILVNNSPSEIRRVPQVYPTIQSAIDSSSFEDTILVDKGSYIEQQLGIDKPLTIVGTDKDSVIVSAQLTVNASNVNIQQLTFLTLGHPSLPIKIIVDSSNNVRFSSLSFTAADAGGVGLDGCNGMSISASKGISLTSVFVKAGRGGPGDADHFFYHLGGNGGYGIMITNSTNVVIDSSTIYGGDAGGGGYANPQGKNGNPLILNDSSIVSLSNSKVKYFILVDSTSSISLPNDTMIFTSVHLSGPPNNMPSKYQLGQNYPNPFNPSTTIPFSLPSKSVVSITVYDVTGRDVATLIHEELPAGNYVSRWNAINVSSGIYFYTIQAGTFRETKKLVLLR